MEGQVNFEEIEARILAAGFVSVQPQKPHKHECGITAFGPLADYGCGYRWEHTAPSMTVTGRTKSSEHMCPACGRGPWFHIVE